MKNLTAILLMFSLATAHAQLEKGSEMAGAQFNLLINDMYSTHIIFKTNATEKTYGFNIVPMYCFALERNWMFGAQATLGIETSKYAGSSGATPSAETWTDLGIAPFTRFYFDISKNKKWKIFAVGALEINTEKRKLSYSTLAASSTPSSTYNSTTGSLGGGIAFFGRKVSLDLNMSNTALRLGIYRIFPGIKK